MSRLARHADRLATGSAALRLRLTTAVQAWIARGRRDDLTGWRAALGCWARLALLGLAGYLLWRLVRAFPNLLWLLSTAWILAAWRAGKTAPEDQDEDGGDASWEASVESVRRLLLEVMGDADAVHLRTVLARLHQDGQWEGHTVTDMRTRLTLLGIPADRNVKVGGIPTWGVRRRDLEAPSPVSAEQTSAEPSTAA
ncbi:hypothetical protein [Streptomyces justiciae]|uniref:Uncharacterized protein n=1 Tax=Streptomyces justiciae TaxID=2780140 RepID=A0ABU3M6S3_9ACTN|nr:hypothetical protein [Streptomyces justiciae]MDT7847221.1 hypothetical protein [Streptomyces justiciae]